MVSKPALLALSLLAMPVWVGAQQVYRCGNTFSQTPCGPEAAPKRVFAGGEAKQPDVLAGRELCRAETVNRLQVPDPESTRVKSMVKGASEVIQYAGQPVVARKFHLVINTKNAAGVYVGEQIYVCYLSEDERRVLSVTGPAP